MLVRKLVWWGQKQRSRISAYKHFGGTEACMANVMRYVAYSSAFWEKKKTNQQYLEKSSEEERELMYLPHVVCVNFPTCTHVTSLPEDREKYRVKAVSSSKSHVSRVQETKTPRNKVFKWKQFSSTSQHTKIPFSVLIDSAWNKNESSSSWRIMEREKKKKTSKLPLLQHPLTSTSHISSSYTVSHIWFWRAFSYFPLNYYVFLGFHYSDEGTQHPS